MSRYQTLSQRASEATAPPSGWVSAGESKFASLPESTPAIATTTSATTATSTRLTTNAVPAERSASEARLRAIACAPMRAVDIPIADSFWADHRNAITAIITVVGAFVLAHVVDRAISHRGSKLASAMPGPLSPVASTRLRLVRRLIYVGIIVIGLALALAQFAAVKRVATGVLASSAVLGLVVGFAARQTLANVVAGILLAITQPIRIGDVITFEDQTGEVEDVKLTYTYIRLDDGRRLIVPNERLAQSSVLNHTILDARVQAEVSIWLPADADLEHAIELIEDPTDGISAVVAESTVEGVRLSATTWADTPAERGKAAVELRRRCLRLLREHGLSSVEAS